MFAVPFETPTCIETQEVLQKLFRTDKIYLAPGARVTFEGLTILNPEVMLLGDCHFLGPLRIEQGSVLTDVRMGRENVVRAYSILSDLTAGDRNLFGPFCFIRDQCHVADDCILGAHVELARSKFGMGVKISHRAFVGDAEIADQTIIGAGVVFCNFDGQDRQATHVGMRATVGSGSLLVAPLKIGDDAVIAAGSTVTKDVLAKTKLIQKR
jgi:bifunctional UDP-N-acetylglucosamine pyrophosphorylase/glucosamine-1-phosphate N-acetyltransferase